MFHPDSPSNSPLAILIQQILPSDDKDLFSVHTQLNLVPPMADSLIKQRSEDSEGNTSRLSLCPCLSPKYPLRIRQPSVVFPLFSRFRSPLQIIALVTSPACRRPPPGATVASQGLLVDFWEEKKAHRMSIRR